MKTITKKLIALTLTALLFGISTTNTFAEDGEKVTILSDVKKVNKINVSGNVELILIQSTDESVKVYDSYYAKNALVQQKEGELRISSFNKETLTVVVYVSNVTSITATDNAVVRTIGRLQTPTLTVQLKDNASAKLEVNTLMMNADLSGIARLTLSGLTAVYTAQMGSFTKADLAKYTAESSNIQSKNNAIAKAVESQTPQLPDAE